MIGIKKIRRDLDLEGTTCAWVRWREPREKSLESGIVHGCVSREPESRAEKDLEVLHRSSACEVAIAEPKTVFKVGKLHDFCKSAPLNAVFVRLAKLHQVATHRICVCTTPHFFRRIATETCTCTWEICIRDAHPPHRAISLKFWTAGESWPGIV